MCNSFWLLCSCVWQLQLAFHHYHQHEGAQRVSHTLHHWDPKPSLPAQRHPTLVHRPLWVWEAAVYLHDWRVLPAMWRQRELPPAAMLAVNRALLVCWHCQWTGDTKYKYTTGGLTCQLWWAIICLCHIFTHVVLIETWSLIFFKKFLNSAGVH